MLWNCNFMSHECYIFHLSHQLLHNCNLSQITDLKKQQESLVLDGRLGNGHVHDCAAREHRITLLEEELQQQEQLMLGYQHENDKLCQAMRQLKVWFCFLSWDMLICKMPCDRLDCSPCFLSHWFNLMGWKHKTMAACVRKFNGV